MKVCVSCGHATSLGFGNKGRALEQAPAAPATAGTGHRGCRLCARRHAARIGRRARAGGGIFGRAEDRKDRGMLHRFCRTTLSRLPPRRRQHLGLWSRFRPKRSPILRCLCLHAPFNQPGSEFPPPLPWAPSPCPSGSVSLCAVALSHLPLCSQRRQDGARELRPRREDAGEGDEEAALDSGRYRDGGARPGGVREEGAPGPGREGEGALAAQRGRAGSSPGTRARPGDLGIHSLRALWRRAEGLPALWQRRSLRCEVGRQRWGQGRVGWRQCGGRSRRQPGGLESALAVGSRGGWRASSML